MKSFLIFVAGLVVGVVFAFSLFYILGKSYDDQSSDDGITMFSEVGDCISKNQFEVFQVLEPGMALALEGEHLYGNHWSYTGMTALFINDDGKHYYDNEIIKVPSGKCVKQVGIFEYTTKNGIGKTVPIVKVLKTNSSSKRNG